MTNPHSKRRPSLARWLGAGAATSLAALGFMIALWAASTGAAGRDDASGLAWVLVGIAGAGWLVLCLAAVALLRGAGWWRLLPFVVSIAWSIVNVYATLARLPGTLPALPAPIVVMVITGFTIPAAAVLAVVAITLSIITRRRAAPHLQ